MKKLGNHIDGNVRFKNGVDYSQVERIGGYVYCRSTTLPENAFPKLTSIGDYVYCEGATLPENAFPKLTSIGGYVYCRSTTLPENAFPKLTSIGGSVYCEGATLPENAFPKLTSIGGSVDCRSTTLPENAFPKLTSIGGSVDCRSTTLPDSLKSAKTNDPDCPAKETASTNLLKSFLRAGFLFADGILSKYISKRASGGTTIWKVTVCGKIESSYVIEKDGICSHGKTLKEAKASFIFKITDHDTNKYESWGLDKKVGAAEAITSYRAITGACEFGVRDFCEKKGVDLSGQFSPREIINLTHGAYGNNQYRDFFQKRAAAA